ncbi:MAG: plasma-membrane proton-efflux P-type ATPase [Burkholderiales bacterium]|nr:plasma-membrane proton-efflux P-type ATPase [Burkholderiales bacterium]
MEPSATPDPATGGLGTQEAQRLLATVGANEVAGRPERRWQRFLAKFWGPSAWMLETIAVVSLLLGKHGDAGLVALLLVLNAVLAYAQERRASAALEALKQRLQLEARVLRDGRWQKLPARELVPGDVIRCRAGDLVPADARIASGSLTADESVLTGESRELAKQAGDMAYSGTLVRHGEATAEVTATGTRSRFGRTAQLVRDAQPQMHVEALIARIVRWLALIVGTLVAAVFVLAWLQGQPVMETARLSLVLLMSAVPVALPVMLTVTMAAGALELSRQGVLVTHLSAAEDAAVMDTLLVDKTGTLTRNQLELAGLVALPGFTEDEVLRTAALASDEADQDPIDLAVLHAAAARGLPWPGPGSRISFSPFDPANRRTEALVRLDGRPVRAMKGAVRTLAQACGLAGDALQALLARVDQAGEAGQRALAVARSEGDGPPVLLGLLLLQDPPRPDAGQLVRRLRDLGIDIKMLTGDALPVARSVARQIGLGEIARYAQVAPAGEGHGTPDAAALAALDGFAEVYPEDKFAVARQLQSADHVVGMTGDGVNDAPALRQAEVGIAVAGATDTAKAAASVVLTQPGLTNIVPLVEHGRMAYQRVLTWILNKISRTIVKAGFVAVAFVATGRFVVSAFAMLLLVFMTDLMKVSLATDRVAPSPRPESWDIAPQVKIAVVLGLLMLLESLAALAAAWRPLRLDADAGRLYAFSFLVMLYFGPLSILSLRERRWFGASRPGRLLATAMASELVIGTIVSQLGIAELHPLPLAQVLLLLAYAMACSLLLNDPVKVGLMRRLHGAGGAALPD